MGRWLEGAKKFRTQLDGVLPSISSNTTLVNTALGLFKPWTVGTMSAPIIYAADEVRMENGIPYKCVQAHTNHGEAGWNPSSAASLWVEYHGTSADTARPYKAPTGAHDMYLVGEYMIFNRKTYKCKQNTAYSPTDYTAAWEVV